MPWPYPSTIYAFVTPSNISDILEFVEKVFPISFEISENNFFSAEVFLSNPLILAVYHELEYLMHCNQTNWLDLKKIRI